MICLVGFYGISTLVGHLMPNQCIHTCISYLGFANE